MRTNNKGFTLIELVLVITILGILAVMALPNFIDVSTKAKQSARDGVVGAVRAGINLFKAKDLVDNGPPGNYPATLDARADGTTAGPGLTVFDNVLQQGVADSGWTKTDATHYSFSDGTTTYVYTYSTTTGQFSSPTAGP